MKDTHAVDLEFTVTPDEEAKAARQRTAAHLFIDDCPDANPLGCYDPSCTRVGDLGNRGMCWNWSHFRCEPCQGGYDGTAQECNAKFTACHGRCTTDWGLHCGTGP